MKRTEIADIGEFGLIKRLAAPIKTYKASTHKGIGDDAAVVQHDGLETVITSDMLLEGVHFDLAYTPLRHLGYKAVAVNISDIAAMNATPEQITVNVALSNRFSVEAVEELYQGMRLACEAYQVDLVGGDTTASRSGLVISITALGRAPKGRLAFRNTAQKGDIICVTGDLGGAYLGLQLLEREKQVFLANPDMQPELIGFEYVVRRQLKPEARMDIIHELKDLEVVPTAMIDVSDGLASELLHLTSQSGLGATLYEDKLPVDQETWKVASEIFQISPTTCALNGGEDYELLFTIKQSDYEKIKYHEDISFIGFMHEAEKGVHLITRADQKVAITAMGWQHFQR